MIIPFNMPVTIKRIFEEPSPSDGYRVLVDRLWPRGMSKGRACLDEWLKIVAPSQELRIWFDHDVTKWAEFRHRYLNELKQHRELLRPLANHAKKNPVTVVYGASDEKHNNAVVVRQYLKMLDAM